MKKCQVHPVVFKLVICKLLNYFQVSSIRKTSKSTIKNAKRDNGLVNQARILSFFAFVLFCWTDKFQLIADLDSKWDLL